MEYTFKKAEIHPILSGHLHLGGKNPSGGEITLNSKHLIRDGKPWIPVMGEMHFTRVRREDWKKELAKMKAGGITLVSTYIFWIYHEECEGEFDFSGNQDIRAFVELCGELGLEVVVRIGPWAHGECRNGGFPDWLLQKGFETRTNNEEYLRYARIWYKKIAKQLCGLYYKNGGPIIAIQLENELTDNAEHLLRLKEMAIDCGIIVPLYTVTGWNSVHGAKIPVDDVLPVFGGYGEAPWETHTHRRDPSPHFFFNTMRNDSAIGSDIITDGADNEWQLPYEIYPFATCELGSGIQVSHHRRPRMSAMDSYVISLVKLGDGNNLPGYYMYHGGTNQLGKLSTLNEPACPILSYDFQAPIGEFGIVREHCGLLNMLHLFVRYFGEQLAVMDTALGQEVEQFDTKKLRYAMRTDGKGGFVFVNHYQRLTELEDVTDVRFKVNDELTFPENSISISGQLAFFMPFNMTLGSALLEYATTQPLCRDGNTYFFAKLPGIEAEYKIDGEIIKDMDFTVNGTRIITLSYEQAKKLRRLDGKLYIGDNCDLYSIDGKIYAAQNGSFSYLEWNGNEFDSYTVDVPYTEPELLLDEVSAPDFKPKYLEELQIGGERKVTWHRVKVKGDEGYITLPYRGDAAQLYADGVLIADEYWYGEPWQIPARLLVGKEVYFGYSELKDDCYIEEE